MKRPGFLLLRISFALSWAVFPAGRMAAESWLDELEEAISRTQEFDSLHVTRIDQLREEFQRVGDRELSERLQLAEALFAEYEVFRHDSAFIYAKKVNQLAHRLGDDRAVATSRIRLGSVFVSAGLYKEALDSLDLVSLGSLPADSRAWYHGLMGRCFGDMAEFTEVEDIGQRYLGLAYFHRDSALILAESGSFFHDFMAGYLPSTRGSTREAYNALVALYHARPHHPRDLALLTYVLGDLAVQLGDQEAAIGYLAQAATIDLQTSAKENLAMIQLAQLLFERGETRLASRLIRKAHKDAQFFGARQRQMQVGEILPFIDEQVIDAIETQKSRLWTATLLVSGLLVFVVALAVVIWRQVQRLRRAKSIIDRAHELQRQINDQLREANRIKEEYIGYFFHRDVQLTDLLEKFKDAVGQKLNEQDWPDIRSLLKSRHFRDQHGQLLHEFDEAVIRLFPRYVEEFNALFPEGSQTKVKAGELLNAELRIYALLRLGVSDNEKIAQILGYSVNTIYMYKSRVRKRSILPADSFDQVLLSRITLEA